MLGFESASHWSTSAGQLSTSAIESEGQASVTITDLPWYAQLTSGTLTSLGSIGTSATLDVRIGQEVSWGEVRLIVTAPSLGEYWRDIGGGSLVVLPNTFHRLEFSIPEDLRQKLSGQYNDLRFVIALSAPPGQYWLDRLELGAVEPAPAPPPEVDAIPLELRFPRGLDPSRVALLAQDSLKINDGVRFPPGILGRPTLVNMGEGQTELGADTRVGSICSLSGNTFLRERAKIYGFLEAAGGITYQNEVGVTGEVQTSANTSEAVAQFEVQFSMGSKPTIFLEPDQQHQAVPGDYAVVRVGSRSTLQLTTGTYRFDELHVEPEGQLALDTLQGPVVIHVKSSLSYKGTVTENATYSPGTGLLLIYAGEQAVFIESALRGTLVAPKASVTLASLNGLDVHAGSVFASSIEIHQYNVFRQAAVRFRSLVPGGFGGTIGVGDRFRVPKFNSELAQEFVTITQLTEDDIRTALQQGERFPPALNQPVGSQSRPVPVLRDNPVFRGTFNWGAESGSTAVDTYSTNHQWTGEFLMGSIGVTEFSTNGQVAFGRSPILPIQGVQSGAQDPIAKWTVRTLALAQGNSYSASFDELVSNTSAPSTVPLEANGVTFRLNTGVIVVPIVVVSWMNTNPTRAGQDWTHIARAMFDFIPPYTAQASYSPGPYTRMPAELLDPEQAGTNHSEHPPDELYADCGIQFQVVDTFVFEWPDLPFDCTGIGRLWGTRSEVFARIRESVGDTRADQLEALAPIIANYGDHNCVDFFAKADISGNMISVAQDRGYQTAHELAHVLTRQTIHSDLSDNILHSFPQAQHTVILPEQCLAMRSNASIWRTKMREYNEEIGRVAPPDVPEDPELPTEFPLVPRPQNVESECCSIEGEAQLTPQGWCPVLGGVEQLRTECFICCASGPGVSQDGTAIPDPLNTVTLTPLEQCEQQDGYPGLDVQSACRRHFCCDADGIVFSANAGSCALKGGKPALTTECPQECEVFPC